VKSWCFSVSLFAALSSTCSANASSRDGIEFWAGTGSKRATLVVDWSDVESSRPAIAWGFRWEGAATGADMLAAIVAADPRLFVRWSASGSGGQAVYGIGYDADGDNEFALDDATVFDAEGFALSGPSDTAASIDLLDFYAEGWLFSGFWHYGVAASNPNAGGAWVSSSTGASGRSLVDGAWDAWTFTASYSYQAFPEVVIAAPAPANAGDYNRDGRVDAADYTVWRDTLGSAAGVAGAGADGDRSFVIDAADYGVWRDAYGFVSGSAVPEPLSACLVFVAIAAWRRRCLRRVFLSFNDLEVLL
jgi:hypothetical protein